MRWLGELAHGRDNNLNLIRSVAAIAVLISHAYPIALGPGTPEPLKALTGHALGSTAVYVFFAISGFLIAASWMRGGGAIGFWVSRGLRLIPGLAVSLLIVALVLGPMITDYPPGEYFRDPGVWNFLWRNLTLVEPLYTLPGVFETQPMRAIEGSIWTLFYEVACYAGLFLLGAAGLLARPRAMVGILAAFFALWLWREATGAELFHHMRLIIALGLPFAIGIAFWTWREWIPLHLAGVGGTIVLALVLSDTVFYTAAFMLALAYATFWLAYVPSGILRSYNRIGDYSYGIYIYAFPCQGLAIWLAGPMSPTENMLLGLALTLPLAILSWHAVEAPALKTRRSITSWLEARMKNAKPGTSRA